jgi:putative DNA primase/helicase
MNNIIYHDIVLDYLNHNFDPIPIKFKSKNPTTKGWTKLAISENDIDAYFSGNSSNIGIVTGEPSRGLVDIDIDAPDALRFAPYFLPETRCIFGRLSKPRSHWVFRVPDVESHKEFRSDGMIVEVRGNGRCTVFPGSVHESGESIEFENPDDYVPSTTTWAELTRASRNIAIATVLYRHWSQGNHCRHDLALSATAALARRAWGQDEVIKLIEAVATEANDEELEDRLLCVRTTFASHGNGQPISGEEMLADLLGKDIAEHIRKWASATGSRKKSASSGIGPKPEQAITDITSDAGAADAFATAFKDRLVYSKGEWFHKKVQVLEPVSAEVVQGLAKQFFQQQVGKIAVGPLVFSTMKGSLSRARINAAVELSRSAFYVDSVVLDANIDLVGCRDGNVFDLNSGTRLNNPQAFVTKKIGATVSPNAACPLWTRFLNQIFDGNVDAINFVRRAVGYCLSGSVSEQCLFILVGTGANGKSTFLRTLQHVFGDYAGGVPMSTLMEQRFPSQQTNDLAYLLGKRFVAASEGERGQKLAESKIKMMTGGDRIVCRSMYKDFFEFHPQFKLWLATNDLPSISGMDDAIWRRIFVIRFPVKFAPAQQDKLLSDRLVEESPGIFNWAHQGYREWTQGGLNPPPQVVQSTGTYRKDNDSVGQWIDSACVLEPSARTGVKELYESYRTWCDNSGLEPMANACFGKELTRRGFENIKGRSCNGRLGIALKPSEDDPVAAYRSVAEPAVRSRLKAV